MAKNLVLVKDVDGIETELLRDAITGGWDVTVTDSEDVLTIRLEPQDTPNRIQLDRVETFKGEDGQFYFAGVAVNNEVVFPSEGYKTKRDRDHAADSLADKFGVKLAEREVPVVDSSSNPDVSDEEIEANEKLKLEEELAAAAVAEASSSGGIERIRRGLPPEQTNISADLPLTASSVSPAAGKEVVATAEKLAADEAAAQVVRDAAGLVRAGKAETTEKALAGELIETPEEVEEQEEVEEAEEA